MPNLPWGHATLFQLTITGSSYGVQIVNVHHFEASGLTEAGLNDDSEAQGFGASIGDAWITHMKSSYLSAKPNHYKLDKVSCQVIERPGNFRHRLSPVEDVLTSSNAGSNPAQAEELMSSAVIRWRTPIAGKSFRGRSYIGPIPSAWMADGKLEATGSAAVSAYATALFGRWGVGGTDAGAITLTVYSRPYNSGEYQYATRKTGSLTVVTPPDYAGNSTNITGWALDATVRVQRRRELGVGS